MTLCGVNMSYSKKSQLIQRSQNSSKRRQLFSKLLLFININIGRLLKAGGRPTLELLWGCLTSLSLHFVLQPDEIWVIAPHDGLHTCACTNTQFRRSQGNNTARGKVRILHQLNAAVLRQSHCVLTPFATHHPTQHADMINVTLSIQYDFLQTRQQHRQNKISFQLQKYFEFKHSQNS